MQHSPLGIWKFTRDVLSRGMAGTVSSWQYGIDGLAAVAARFRTIQVENYPAIRIIELYDTPDTLFYCDPPYVQDTRETSHRRRDYTNEMSDNDHRDLAAALHKIRGRAAISGFPSQLYDELYGDWNKIMMPRLANTSSYRGRLHQESAERIEVLWTNYPLGKGKEGGTRIMQEQYPLRKPYATRIRTLITCLTCSNELYLIHAPYRPFKTLVPPM
jgi:DNA adenine methylase